jgi:hypothetical protein
VVSPSVLLRFGTGMPVPVWPIPEHVPIRDRMRQLWHDNRAGRRICQAWH